MVTRWKTGIPGLDEHLEGGFPAPAAVAVFGEPGVGKSTFCQQVAWQGLQVENTHVAYITVDQSPEDIRNSMERFGWDVKSYEKANKFIIIDCFSERMGYAPKEKYFISKPYELTPILKELHEIALTLEKTIVWRNVMDSISALSPVLGLLNTYRLCQRLQGYTREFKSIGFATFHSGVQDKKEEYLIKLLADGVITLKRENGRKYLKIEKMIHTKHPTLKEYRIAENGIKIL